jgi:hypothetical protein
MTTQAIVEKLASEAKVNPVWNAVAHVFALRERARSQVTVSALSQRMKDEGFTYERKDIEDVLKLLSSVGVGKLVKDSEGRIDALVDIKLTLQSIGKVAAGQDMEIHGFRRKAKFSRLPRRGRHVERKVVPFKPVAAPKQPDARVILTVVVGGKSINIPVSGLTPQEIANLISDLRG